MIARGSAEAALALTCAVASAVAMGRARVRACESVESGTALPAPSMLALAPPLDADAMARAPVGARIGTARRAAVEPRPQGIALAPPRRAAAGSEAESARGCCREEWRWSTADVAALAVATALRWALSVRHVDELARLARKAWRTCALATHSARAAPAAVE